MSTNLYGATALIGGAAGALDAIDGADLADLDGAIVITAGQQYIYSLDVNSAAGESSPDIISPDANAGDKRWILISKSDQGVAVADTPSLTGLTLTDPLTLTGTGRINRHFRIGAASFYKQNNPPEDDLVGIIPVLKFDAGAVDEQAYYSDTIPFRLVAGGEIIVNVDWCYEGEQDNGTVVWGIEFININTGEVVANGTTTITGKSAGTHTTGVLVRTAIDDVANITGSVADDVLSIRVYRDSSDEANDTLAVDACLIQVHLHFIMDKLGEPT